MRSCPLQYPRRYLFFCIIVCSRFSSCARCFHKQQHFKATPSCLLARSDGATPLPLPCQATTACLASKRATMIMTGTVCILEMSLASRLRVHKALRYKSSASEDLDEAFWDQDKGEITIFFKKGQRLKKSLTC